MARSNTAGILPFNARAQPARLKRQEGGMMTKFKRRPNTDTRTLKGKRGNLGGKRVIIPDFGRGPRNTRTGR